VLGKKFLFLMVLFFICSLAHEYEGGDSSQNQNVSLVYDCQRSVRPSASGNSYRDALLSGLLHPEEEKDPVLLIDPSEGDSVGLSGPYELGADYGEEPEVQEFCDGGWVRVLSGQNEGAIGVICHGGIPESQISTDRFFVRFDDNQIGDLLCDWHIEELEPLS
jgi:hypothetical protein